MAITPVPRSVIWLMILICGFVAGNIYYTQPLLALLSVDLNLAPSAAGLLTTITLTSYVLGLILITPLGDVLEKKQILRWLLIFETLSLAGCAASTNFVQLQMACALVGAMAVSAQILIPAVAELSPEKDRAQNLGWILSACLIGILGSRVIAGWLAQHFSWRISFAAASFTMFLLTLLLERFLPPISPPTQAQPQSWSSYRQLLLTLLLLTRNSKGLRQIALVGALTYAAFAVLWSSLSFELRSPPLNAGPDIAGAFGFLGIAGALASQLGGKALAHTAATRLMWFFTSLMVIAYLAMGFFQGTWWSLVVGVLLLDAGAQGFSVCNQNEIYKRYADARTRRNTIYKIYYFGGGALGASLSPAVWQVWGWSGVCVLGGLFLFFASLAQMQVMRHNRKSSLQAQIRSSS